MNIFRSASALVAVLYLCPVAHAMGGRSATPEELQQFDAEFGPAFRKMQAANEEYGRELQERMRRRLAGETDPPVNAPPPSAVPDPPNIFPTEATLIKTIAETRDALAMRGGVNSLYLDEQFLRSYSSQGQAGTCLLFASTALYEAGYFRETGHKIDLSEMWIIRNWVGQTILSMKNGIPYSGIYLGVDVDYWRGMAIETGICQEKTYPYWDVSASTFEHGLPVRGDEETVFEKRVGLFTANFSAAAVKVQSCRAESEPLARLFKNFSARTSSIGSVEQLVHVVAAGIPVSISIYRDRHGTSLGPGHQVVITGVDLAKRSFLIRNSWGPAGVGLLSPWLSFDAVATGFILDIDDHLRETGNLQFVVTPKDRERICRHPETVPAPMEADCRLMAPIN
jgi:hypothetical protein